MFGAQARRALFRLAGPISALACILCASCCPFFGTQVDPLVVTGQLVDEGSSETIGGAFVQVRTFTGEEMTFQSALFLSDGVTPIVRPTEGDGIFSINLLFGGQPICVTPLGPRLPPPVFPNPDRLEIVAVRESCEFTFSIDVNEETVVDLSFPGDVLELRDPIRVPICDDLDSSSP